MAVSNERPPTGYTGKPATDFRMGLVRLATNAEATAGVANNLAVTPAQLNAISTGANFASPPVLGSVAPNVVLATTLGSTGNTDIASNAGSNAIIGNATGMIGFFGAAGATVIAQSALTNSVTVGGTTGTIANFTDLTVYATDAATIRNDIYQLSLALSGVINALRNYGLLN